MSTLAPISLCLPSSILLGPVECCRQEHFPDIVAKSTLTGPKLGAHGNEGTAGAPSLASNCRTSPTLLPCFIHGNAPLGHISMECWN
jgi:hypothetical protein